MGDSNRRPGRQPGPRDEQLIVWLDEYRALLEQPQDPLAPAGGSRWDFLNKPHVEKTGNMRPSILSRWWGRKTTGANRTPVILTRQEFFQLLHWTPGPVPNITQRS